MPIVGYVEAIASERASFQQQVDDIQRAYNRQQKASDTRLPITRDQALSDAKTNHAVECAAIIAQAYHNGDYNGFWQALSEATRIDLFCFTEPLINSIVRHTITLTGLYDRHINEASLHVEQFTDTIIRDAPTAPSVGAYRLFNHLYDEGNAREADGNTLWESDARTAHALVCCELAGRNHITVSDLAELIATMSGQRTFHDLTLNTPHGRQHTTNVEELIDAASPYMTR